MLMHGRLLIILVGLAVGPVQGLEAKKVNGYYGKTLRPTLCK